MQLSDGDTAWFKVHFSLPSQLSILLGLVSVWYLELACIFVLLDGERGSYLYRWFPELPRETKASEVGGVLLYISYMGMGCCEGYYFQAVYFSRAIM